MTDNINDPRKNKRAKEIREELEKKNPGVEFTEEPVARISNFYAFTTDEGDEVILVEDDLDPESGSEDDTQAG